MSINYEICVNQYESYTQYPDLFFEFGDEVVKANKCILANYSDYFRALFEYNHRDAVGVTRENSHEINTIAITTVSKKIFEFILKSIYADVLPSNKMLVHTFFDDEAYEMISFAHSILVNTPHEKNLVNEICQIYAEQTTNITNLSRLSIYSFGKQYINVIGNLIKSGRATNVESLEKNDITNFLSRIAIALEDILELDSSLVKYVELDNLTGDEIVASFDVLSTIHDKHRLVDIICTNLHPEIFVINQKYIIGYRLFSDPRKKTVSFSPQLIIFNREQKIYLEINTSLMVYYSNPVSKKVVGLCVDNKAIKVPPEYYECIKSMEMTIDDSSAQEIDDTVYPPPPLNLKEYIPNLPIFHGEKVIDSDNPSRIYTIESYKDEIIKTTSNEFLTKLERIYYIPHKLELHEFHLA